MIRLLNVASENKLHKNRIGILFSNVPVKMFSFNKSNDTVDAILNWLIFQKRKFYGVESSSKPMCQNK